jgi:hypothetical protein
MVRIHEAMVNRFMIVIERLRDEGAAVGEMQLEAVLEAGAVGAELPEAPLVERRLLVLGEVPT